jgi:YtkA-like
VITLRLRDRSGLPLWVLCGFICVVSLFTVDCSRSPTPPSSVRIEHEINPEPARVGPVTVTLRLADATGKPLTGAHIAMEADMTHAGMSPVFAEAREMETAGRYQGAIQFRMAGDWLILLHVTLPDGKKLERQIDVRGVRPN